MSKTVVSGDWEEFEVRDVVAAYNLAAPNLLAEYERPSFESVHAAVLDLLPESAGSVLDVGAGSGRDAAWFAARGHNVVAVEPSTAMRETAKARHRSPRIRWIDDSLPALNRVLRSKCSFDLVWLSAIWQHLPRSKRARSFRKLVSTLSPGGSMMVSLRRGPPPLGRPTHPATTDDIEKLARRHGLQTIRIRQHKDVNERKGVSWQTIWLQLPDDGTGALPLLRHIVFNDQKSSTYKLALLRTLLRIADSTGGFVRPGPDENHVNLPLGLVALYWVRTFKPLIEDNLPQHPNENTQLRFVKDGFRGLKPRSPFDLRVGQRFIGKDAANLIRALRDAANCIRIMPATYITYPGSKISVFPCSRNGQVRLRDVVHLDETFLWSLGTFTVPLTLWQAMGRYARWLEPAVLNEWIRIMRNYETVPRSWDVHWDALRWLEPRHDTGIARRRAEALSSTGSLFCIWTGNRLRKSFDIDHCLPFSAWPCNDLWNLLPSRPQTNNQKGDRLPSPDALEQARPRLLEWWDSAFLHDTNLAERFEDEARSALPAAVPDDGTLTPESLFEGVMIQQMVLKRDQQLREWHPN